MSNATWAYGDLLFPEKDAVSSSITNDDWNTRFQSIIAMPTTTTNEKLHKFTLLHTLNKDFIACASTYTRIIVSELYLPNDKKSVQLQPLGGVAGGKKYLWRGILFKFANGMQGPYNNNDEYASKGIGHDLKGANSYFRCGISGLHVALQAVIDYKGHRVHAQAQLPIDDSTLVIGSADACKTIRSNHFDLLQKLKFAAQELNLREHTIRDIKLFSACDVEGHIGHDNRAYIIDLARTFPPEDPTVTTHLHQQRYQINDTVLYRNRTYTIHAVHATSYDLHCPLYSVKGVPKHEVSAPNISIFWRLLRPELVKNYGNTLLEQLLSERYEGMTEEYEGVECAVISPAPATTIAVATSTTAGVAGDGYSFANVLQMSPPTLQRNISTSSNRSDGMYDASELLSPGNSSSVAGSTFSYLAAAMKSAPPAPSLRKTISTPSPSTSTTVRRIHSTPARPLNILSPSTPSTAPPVIPELRMSPALSPDAFSSFSESDPSAGLRNSEVTNATTFLVKKLIPEMARNLTVLAQSNRLSHLHITEYMHKFGVNIRHLGLLYSHIPSSHSTAPLRSLLIQECILRTLKHISRDMVRSYMKHCQRSSEDAVHAIWVQILNLVSLVHANAATFWSDMKNQVIRRFGAAAIDEHPSDGVYPSWTLITGPEQSHQLILRLCSISGVLLSAQCKQQLSGYQFEFAIADIVEIIPVVKHMHQVDLAEGILLLLLAQQQERQRNNAIITRLLSLSSTRLHRALHTLPNDLTTSLALSDVYQAWGLAATTTAAQEVLFANSRRYLTAEHTRCFETGTSYRDDILGICLMIAYYPRNDAKQNWRRAIKHVYFCLDTFCSRFVHAGLDLERFQEAFGQKGLVRFFPLIFDEEHASRALPLLQTELVKAYVLEDDEYTNDIALPPFSASIGLSVISAIMNSMVVDFVSAAENGNLLETAFQGYSRFHHMLLYLSNHTASAAAAWNKEANRVVDQFITSAKHRSKQHTPDLGRFLVYLLVSNREWSSIREIFLQEAFTRQVSWWVREASELLLLEDTDVCLYRLVATFAASKKALRIIMFQIYFIESVAPQHQQNSDWLLQLYNSSLGRPTAAMRGEVVAQFQAILAVSNYYTFLQRVGSDMTPMELTTRLRNAVRSSLMYWRDDMKGRYKGVIDTWAAHAATATADISWMHALQRMETFDMVSEKNRRSQQLKQLMPMKQSHKNVRYQRETAATTTGSVRERGSQDSSNTRSGHWNRRSNNGGRATSKNDGGNTLRDSQSVESVWRRGVQK